MNTKAPNRVFLCGHHEGVDCASGARRFDDFITSDEAVAKAHVARFVDSWSARGFYVAVPVLDRVPDIPTG